MTTDLLLLNATNYRPNLIFPYAFVQVRAIARAHGLSVQSRDLFGHSESARAHYLSAAIERLRPRAVGFHVRQCDSLVLSDYVSKAPRPYYPLAATREAIRQVRQLHSGPVVLGGFGFSTHPQGVLRYLEADLGVSGEPDAFFADFERALRGADVDNVIREAGQSGRRKSFGPLDDREYDDEVVDQLERFYGRSVLYGPRPPTVAVELARGCPFRCSFCAEPAVKGRRARHRDLDAVFGDIEFLLQRGIGSFWLVCSELNHGSSELGLQVAERFIALRERYPGRPVTWRAYVLPRWLSNADTEILRRSGFSGGWNDFPSLDDKNLSDTRVPYRTRHIHEHLEQTLAMHRLDVGPGSASFGAFLGNEHSSPASIVRTFDYFDEHFYGKFASSQIGAGTRLLATMDRSTLDALQPNATSFVPEGALAEVDITHPTYALPTAVTDCLGVGLEAAQEFFEYARVTFLSREFEPALDWARFLRQSCLVRSVRDRLGRLRLAAPPALEGTRVGVALARLTSGEPDAVATLLDPAPDDVEAAGLVAKVVCHRMAARSDAAPAVLEWLGFTQGRAVTPWKLFRACALRADSFDELVEALSQEMRENDAEATVWLLRYYAFRYGLRLQPNFSRLVRVGAQQARPKARSKVHLSVSAA